MTMLLFRSMIFSIGMIFISVSFLLFPQQGLEAALQGIHIWWDVLFPALFPFFVISEMLLGFGIVHFLGALLDPMMRPVFRVPGSGGFVMAMGFAAGYPIGAKLTSQLWQQRLVNRDEGERLVAFTSTSDPIFLIGAVAIGFFHDASLALILAVSHYGGGIFIGLIMRFHGQPPLVQESLADQPFILTRAFHAMHNARMLDGRPIGLLLRQAVTTSFQLVFVIGGLVVFFSVFLAFMKHSGIMFILYDAIAFILQWIHIPEALAQAIINGLFEVTLGAQSAGSAGAEIALWHKAAIAAFILSWSGLSVHAQIISVLNQTDLRYKPFFTARLLHGLISSVLVYVLWEPFEHIRTKAAVAWPVHIPYDQPSAFIPWIAFSTFAMLLITFSVIFILYILYRTTKWIFR